MAKKIQFGCERLETKPDILYCVQPTKTLLAHKKNGKKKILNFPSNAK